MCAMVRMTKAIATTANGAAHFARPASAPSSKSDNIIGEHQAVFLDRGSSDGLKIGNELLVVRRGDAYPTDTGGELTPADMDDRRYPDHDRYIVMVDDQPAGRLYVHQNDLTLHVVDLTLMPEHRLVAAVHHGAA